MLFWFAIYFSFPQVYAFILLSFLFLSPLNLRQNHKIKCKRAVIMLNWKSTIHSYQGIGYFIILSLKINWMTTLCFIVAFLNWKSFDREMWCVSLQSWRTEISISNLNGCFINNEMSESRQDISQKAIMHNRLFYKLKNSINRKLWLL